MKTITRALMVGLGLNLAVAALSPMASSAWQPGYFPVSGTGGPIVMVLNEDQFKGKWKQFKGELKKKWGNFTDDDILYIEGSRDKLDGKIQERYGDRKDEVKKWIDDWFELNKPSNNIKP